jgi:lysozyme
MGEVRTNEAGVSIIRHFEGLVDGDPNTPGLEPYICPAGLPTIGYGAIYGLDGSRVGSDHRAITEEEAESLLKRDLRRTEHAVARLVRYPLTLNQFSALVSICFNIGSGNFQTSVFRMHLNRGDYHGCANNFWQWRRSGGVIQRGLVRRRAAEKELFNAI